LSPRSETVSVSFNGGYELHPGEGREVHKTASELACFPALLMPAVVAEISPSGTSRQPGSVARWWSFLLATVFLSLVARGGAALQLERTEIIPANYGSILSWP
jgi:hypothetical protein